MDCYKMYKRILESNRGSLTVEATIVIPVVIFTLIALILIENFVSAVIHTVC